MNDSKFKKKICSSMDFIGSLTSLAYLEIDSFPKLTSSLEEISSFISTLPQSINVCDYWKDVKGKQVKIGQRLLMLQKVILGLKSLPFFSFAMV